MRATISTVSVRSVAARATLDELRCSLARPLTQHGEDACRVIDEFARDVEPGLVASNGPRYFGFVVGGALPVAVAADWLVCLGSERCRVYRQSRAGRGRGDRRPMGS